MRIFWVPLGPLAPWPPGTQPVQFNRQESALWQFLICFNVREGPREDQGGPGQSQGDPREPWGTPSLALPWVPLVLPGSLPDIETNEKLQLAHSFLEDQRSFPSKEKKGARGPRGARGPQGGARRSQEKPGRASNQKEPGAVRP